MLWRMRICPVFFRDSEKGIDFVSENSYYMEGEFIHFA